MKTIYKISGVVLCLLLIFTSFSACNSSDTLDTTPSFTISHTAPVLPGNPDPPAPSENNPETIPPQFEKHNHWALDKIVTAGYREEFEWMSYAENANHVQIELPSIQPDYPFAKDFNEEMEQYAQTRIKELNANIQHGTDTFLSSVSYEAYLNRDTLSIVVIEQTCIDLTNYTVYNFDMEDRNAMDIAEMADEYLDLEYPQFLYASNEIILREFNERFAQFRDSEPDYYNDIINLITDDPAAMLDRSLYLGQDGQLMMVYDAPSIAGALYYPSRMEFPTNKSIIPTERESWNWFLGLSSELSEEKAAAYTQLLKTAFADDPDDFSDALSSLSDADAQQVIAFILHAYAGQEDILIRLCNEIENPNVRNAILGNIKS